MINIKGAIFDADGTLLDSMWMWHMVEAEYYGGFEVSPRPAFVETLRTLNLTESVEYFQSGNEANKTTDEIAYEIISIMKEFYSRNVLLKPGIIPVLDAFRARGIKMCIATATDEPLMEIALKRTGIYGYFDKIFTCRGENTTKSRPEIFLRAAAFLGTDIKDTLIIEDALYAIKTAKSAGFPVVGVYDKSADSHQDDIKNLCDYYYKTMSDMLEEI